MSDNAMVKNEGDQDMLMTLAEKAVTLPPISTKPSSGRVLSLPYHYATPDASGGFPMNIDKNAKMDHGISKKDESITLPPISSFQSSNSGISTQSPSLSNHTGSPAFTSPSLDSTSSYPTKNSKDDEIDEDIDEEYDECDGVDDDFEDFSEGDSEEEEEEEEGDSEIEENSSVSLDRARLLKSASPHEKARKKRKIDEESATALFSRSAHSSTMTVTSSTLNSPIISSTNSSSSVGNNNSASDMNIKSEFSMSHSKREVTVTHFPDKNKPSLVTAWLRKNYESDSASSLPRNVLFQHYTEFCLSHHIVRLNTAGFGRLLRQTFPNLKTRRLGHRGNSKYFYQGIRVQSSSHLSARPEVLSTMRVGERRLSRSHRWSMQSKQNHKDHQVSSEQVARVQASSSPKHLSPSNILPISSPPDASKIGSNLARPDTTSISSLKPLPTSMVTSMTISMQPSSSLSSFSQTIKLDLQLPRLPWLDKFKEVEWPYFSTDQILFSTPQFQQFLTKFRVHFRSQLELCSVYPLTPACDDLHRFWFEAPQDIIAEACKSPDFVCFVRNCYIVLYSLILSKLLPTILQPLSSQTIKESRDFACQLDNTVASMTTRFRPNLQRLLTETFKVFSQSLKRGVFFNHITQAASLVLMDNNQSSQMLHDWGAVDWNSLIDQAAIISGCPRAFLENVKNRVLLMLTQKAPINVWIDYLQDVVASCFFAQKDLINPDMIGVCCRQFLMRWSYIASLLVRDLTVRSANGFGSFQLLRLFVDECLQAIIDQRYTYTRFQIYVNGPIKVVHPSILLLLESTGCLRIPDNYPQTPIPPDSPNMDMVQKPIDPSYAQQQYGGIPSVMPSIAPKTSH